MFWLDLGAALLASLIDLLYPLLTKEMLNNFIKNEAVVAVITVAAIFLIYYSSLI